MREMEIKLYDMFHTNTLRDRQTALLVVKKLSKIPSTISITINFEKIVFASRSFCHELLVNLKNRKNLDFENTNEMVTKMMITVAKAQKPNVRLNIPIKMNVIS